MYSPATSIQIINFIRSIGIAVDFGTIPNDTFLPGTAVKDGGIIVDSEKLKHPGDLLHLAGHIALVPADKREQFNHGNDHLFENSGNEVAAMAWAYAACTYMGIDSKIVFHDDSYKIAGAVLIEGFSHGGRIGVPMLQWCGMTYGSEQAIELGAEPYPHMVNWLSQR